MRPGEPHGWVQHTAWGSVKDFCNGRKLLKTTYLITLRITFVGGKNQNEKNASMILNGKKYAATIYNVVL